MLKFWYLNHSGFLVETDKHLLVFDYYTDVPKGGTPEQGVVTPELLPQDKQLVVFVSHSHFDHYNKVVHSWCEARENTLMFFGNDIKRSADATRIHGGETLTASGLSVSALHSTDQGVAFLVKVDGKTIYHGGDLNLWQWEGAEESQNRAMEKAFCGEIDKLRGEAIDLAFVPVDPRLERTAFRGGQYFMRSVGAACMVPMHFWEDYSICERFAEDRDNAAFGDRVVRLTHRGQCVTLD